MEKLFGTHWRTTVLGILGLLGLVSSVGTALVQGHAVDWSQTFALLMTSVGLMRAADAANAAK